MSVHNAHTININASAAMREYTGKEKLDVTMCKLYYPVLLPFLKCGEFLEKSSYCRVTGIACLAFTEHTATEQYQKNHPSPTTS